MAKKGEYKSNAKEASRKKREYNAQPEQKKNRAARNQARREANRKGITHKGDGKDVDHKRPLSQGGSNSQSNRRVISRHANRKSGGRIGGLR